MTLASAERALERTVAGFIRSHRLPGASAGIVVGDELAWSLPHGFTELETGAEPDEHTLYRIASITKTFTGAAVLQLRDGGLLGLDEPLVEHVPEFAAASNPFGPIEDVTILRMLTHEAGLPVESPLFEWGGRGYPPIEEIVAGLDRVVLPAAPDSAHKYSNLGYQLLGEVIARGRGEPYESVVGRRLLSPLGMAETTFEPDDGQRARAALGHDARTFSDHLRRSPERSKATTADGGLYSTVSDLARWVSLQFRADAGRRPSEIPGSDGVPGMDPDPVLGSSTLAEMHRPRRMLDAGWTRAQALAWQVMRRGDDVFVGHSGGTFGYSSSVLLEPREGVGAIVLSNGTGPVPALALELLAIGLAAVRDARPLDALLPTRVPERFGELLGLYAWEDLGAHARIEWRAGVLALVWPDDAGEEPQALDPTDDPLRFVVRGGRETGEACVFRRGANGAISGLTLRGWPLARLLAARE